MCIFYDNEMCHGGARTVMVFALKNKDGHQGSNNG